MEEIGKPTHFPHLVKVHKIAQPQINSTSLIYIFIISITNEQVFEDFLPPPPQPEKP
jgi:hypothetical protein